MKRISEVIKICKRPSGLETKIWELFLEVDKQNYRNKKLLSRLEQFASDEQCHQEQVEILEKYKDHIFKVIRELPKQNEG